ncbi:MAG: ABC transporter ATP-binding protein [Thermomicrobiales bacterium]
MSAAATGLTDTPVKRSRARLWRDAASLLREVWTARPLASLAMIGMLVVGNAQLGVMLVAMGGLVDALIGGDAGGRSALFWAGVYVGASAVDEFYWAAKFILQQYLLDHASYRVERRVLERAGGAPLIQFEEGDFFQHLQRAHAGMGQRLNDVSWKLFDVLQVLFMAVSVAGALYVVHPLLLPLMIAGALPALWFQIRTATAVYEAQRAHTMRDRIRAHLQTLLTGREAAPEIRLFGTAGYLLDRWQRLRDERTADVLSAERERAVSNAFGGFFSGATYAGALLFVAYQITGGDLSIGDYVVVATGALWFDQMLGGLVWLVRSIEEESQYLGDLFDFLRVARDEEEDAAYTVASPLERRQGRGMAVAAEGIDFAYPGQAQPVVRDACLRIAPGERIAIVGENGAGKTTLVKLLIGLYRPDAGVVHLDGANLNGGGAIAARQRIAAVFQDYATFQLTLRENIGFGDVERMADDAALRNAAQRAGIEDLLAGLPDGFDAYLGRQFGETELSGGQWQRIALARAFFRDADLLVLDEPTAALDPLAELALFERFAALVKGRTAIMVSHRLGAARVADRIVVLRAGEIVEQGHHDDLIARDGAYAALFAAQAQWYR